MVKPYKVDATDLAIIRRLQRDGRRPFADIASELDLAPSTIQQRANRLFDLGLIKIRAVTDPVALGVPVTAAIAIKAEGARLREVARDIGEFEEVGYVVICTGRHDILIEVACRDMDHLLTLVSEKIARVAGVLSTEIFLYLRIVKNTYQWGIPEASHAP